MQLRLMKSYNYWSCVWWQIGALKSELEVFFGNDPMESKDMSRIVNLYHFERLMKLLQEDGVSDKIVLGGQTDATQL